MQDRILVGITGHLGAGKTTLAHLLADASPYPLTVMSFADSLKSDVHRMVERSSGYTLSGPEIDYYKGPALGLMYQGYGELARLLFGPAFWINRLEPRLTDFVIVDDVRYENEAVWLQAQGGLLIGLEGPCYRAATECRSSTHQSESEVALCLRRSDVMVDNYGTMEQLLEQVRDLTENVIGVSTADIAV